MGDAGEEGRRGGTTKQIIRSISHLKEISDLHGDYECGAYEKKTSNRK